jgi:hypothetical protein
MPGQPGLARGRHAGAGRRREREPQHWWRRLRRERAKARASPPRETLLPAGSVAQPGSGRRQRSIPVSATGAVRAPVTPASVTR